MYSKKIDKKKCESKYKKISEKDRSIIKEKLPLYLKATPDPKFRKNPLTWLNGECWNDEAISEQPKPQTGYNYL